MVTQQGIQAQQELPKLKSKHKCRHCNQHLVEEIYATGKFAGRVVLVCNLYCPEHGQPELTKHYKKLCELVTHVEPLITSARDNIG
ncbi:MAG: hypothetical protein JNM06_15060 [Blastocatellia bacterium]|nr:hypothetical protein [Blastocatellia bacterium]